MSETLLSAQSVSKAYGNLVVLDDVSFDIHPGEILGLVGRRGSGKSTLLHILGGSVPPSAGQLKINGVPAHFDNASQARESGIELVYQTPKLVNQLDVVQNIFLGREIFKSVGRPDLDRMYKEAEALLEQFGLPTNLLEKSVHTLSEEQRQLVSLLRAFCQETKLILIDDILPNLNYPYQRVVLNHLRQLAQRGTSVVISSENLKHLFKITNRILVLYQGKQVADKETSTSTPREVVELIVGTTNENQVTPVIWALESYHVAQKQTETLFRRQAELHENLQASGSLNRELVKKLSEQVTALDQLNAALQTTQKRLLTEREEERKALSRELHDAVMQDLLSINYRLESAEAQEPTELTNIVVGIREVISDLRQLCRDLRPPTLDMHGLMTALRSHAAEWSERTDIPIEVEIDKSIGRLPDINEISIFRIVQEGLSNIFKHAKAQHVWLQVSRTSSDNILIRLTDDGLGFTSPFNLVDLSNENHFGLIGISERAALLGGKMRVTPKPQGGSILEVELPSPFPSA